MIYLWSATPGTGKTCYVVKQLVDNWINDAANKNRKIYCNIADLKIDGIYQPPDDFRDCPDGSLIIYDEAQDIIHYSSDTRDNPVAKALSKHRHRGFDIHFITQDPALLNKWVLKNVFLHYYLWRPAQTQTITIYTFARAIVTPNKDDFKNAFDKKLWRFETHYLQYYKSTVINTSKKIGSTKRNSILVTGFLFFCIIAYFIRPIFTINKIGLDDNQINQQQTEQINNNQQLDNKRDIIKSSDDNIKNDDLDNKKALKNDKQELTKEQLEKQLILQKQQFDLELEKQRTQMIMQYTELQMQLLQQKKQIDEFYRRLEMYKKQLPKDYAIQKSDPNLQVRAVVKRGNDCKAYNANGDLMTLTFDECNYYLQASGRVHKTTGAAVNQLELTPVHQLMDNPAYKTPQTNQNLEQQSEQ